jgi:hypothetical protein
MYDGLYQRLGFKEGEKDIYRMAKSIERKTRSIIQVKCIKDESEWLLTKDGDIKNKWREYFDKLFNKDSGSSSIELDISLGDINSQFMRRIQESEVRCLKKDEGRQGNGFGWDTYWSVKEYWRSSNSLAH